MSKVSCPFCALPAERILLLADEALVIRDAFPVSPGHTLVVPRRHIGSFFELTDAERAVRLSRAINDNPAALQALLAAIAKKGVTK